MKENTRNGEPELAKWWVSGTIENIRPDSPFTHCKSFSSACLSASRWDFTLKERIGHDGRQGLVYLMTETENERETKARKRGKDHYHQRPMIKSKPFHTGIIFLHENTEVCEEYMLDQPIFNRHVLGCCFLFFSAFCWYWTTSASTWPPWIPALIR